MISPDAKTTVKASTLPNSLTGGSVQEFRFSTHEGKSFEVFSFALKASSFDVSALGGKWVKARCRLKLFPWDGWRGINFNTSYMNWASLDPSIDAMAQDTNWELEIETMPFKLGYFPKPVTPFLWIYLNGDHATGDGVARIEQLEFFQVNDPRAPR